MTTTNTAPTLTGTYAIDPNTAGSGSSLAMRWSPGSGAPSTSSRGRVTSTPRTRRAPTCT